MKSLFTIIIVFILSNFFFRLFSLLLSSFIWTPDRMLEGVQDSLHVVWDLLLELPSPIFCLFCGL